MMKVHLLAFGAHPDDVELSSTGTILSANQSGYLCAIADLTRGEMGTRGTVSSRDAEAAAASRILSLADRINLNLRDGFIQADKDSVLAVIRVLRHYQPDIVLAPAREDRHPDHAKAATLIAEACFLSGLAKIETSWDDGERQEAWRPTAIYQYIQDKHIQPDFVVDITPYMEKKLEAVMAYSTQFYNPKSSEATTYISSPDFLEGITSRAREMGRMAGFRYGEGFTVRRTPGVQSVFDLR